MMAVGSKLSTPGALLAELQVAAADRLQDAEALLVAGRFASSIAMGVYSLEIYLKVRICQALNLTALPRLFEIHELEGLLVMTGLQAARNAAPHPDQQNWVDIAAEAARIHDLRYLPSATRSQSDAQTFLQKLRDPPDGVLPWLLAQP
jgi:hypothetical protein